MKKSIGIIAAILFSIITKNNNAQCTASFIDSVHANGYVTFTSTSIGTIAATSYTWSFGNGTSASGVNMYSTSCTYTANGTYTVFLSISTPTACASNAATVVTISNAGPSCSLVAGFFTGQSANGVVNFTNSTAGTNGGTTYSWNYGDGGTSTGFSPPHTYSANGIYTVTLVANNNTIPICVDTKTAVVNVTSYCYLAPAFANTLGASGSVTFQSISTGTAANSTYSWNFGDGANGSGISATHVYSYNGTYTANLTIVNPTAAFTCSNTSSQVIIITTDTCYLNAGFTHTVSAGGLVYFNNASAGTGTSATYSWNFGDGFAASGNSTQHSYSSSGGYIVTLLVHNGGICADTIMQSVNVTGIGCTSNSGFSIAATPTAQYWTATPAFPWNVTAANWNWGDGSSSNTLYSSHSYSSAGTYSICLTVTTSCGGTSSTCIAQYISKGAENAAVVHIDVVPPPTIVIGINTAAKEDISYSIYPNPSNGEFSLRINGSGSEKIKLAIFDLIGNVIFESNEESSEQTKNIDLSGTSNGIYLMKINCGDRLITKKLIVNK